MNETFELRRSIPCDAHYDLVVAGGGPAGTTAAIAAARRGLKVLLVEASGALGGMGTTGLVSSWYCLGNNVETMVGGLTEEIARGLYDRGAVEPDRHPEQWLLTKR
ncbi:MAG: FAD-dependent oxidoreductase, partial [Spirochaetota bacterium]